MRTRRATDFWITGPLVALALITGVACNRVTAPQVTTPAPDAMGSVESSPLPSPGGSPSAATPFFVVGTTSVAGPSVLDLGTREFTITNNGNGVHRFELVSVKPDTTAAAVAAEFRRGADAWPPSWARVVVTTKPVPTRSTATVRVEPLKSGMYALADTAVDPATGKAYAGSPEYVWMIFVLEPST